MNGLVNNVYVSLTCIQNRGNVCWGNGLVMMKRCSNAKLLCVYKCSYPCKVCVKVLTSVASRQVFL